MVFLIGKGDVEKVTKVDVGKVLESINKDSIVVSMGDHGCLVGSSIAIDIIGYKTWNDSNNDTKKLIIEKINRIKLAEKLM